MGFVKTREEVARLQATLAAPHFFSAQMLTIQYLTKSDGQGLEWDPVLVMATFKTKVTLAEKGRGTLTLGNTVHDPLGEIEIVQLLSASYTEGDIYSRCQTLAQINAAEFMPYAYGKIDDWTALNNEAGEPWGQVRVA